MKIALIGTTATAVLGFRADLIKALVLNGHQVYAFALDYTEHSKAGVKDLGAIPIDYEFSRTGLNPFSDIINTYKLTKKIKEIAPDVVFSYFAKPVIFGTFAATLAGVKRRVAMLEGLGYPFTEQPKGSSFKAKILKCLQVQLYRLAFPKLDQIIFLNPDDPVDLIEKYKISVKKINILGAIGLNLSDYPYSDPLEEIVSFIFVGRFLAEKGVCEYIEAAKLVKKIFSNTKFVMLGDIDLQNPGSLTNSELQEIVNDGLVVYPGHVENVADWISNSSVFVLPSYREGVPRSTQEAMAIGRPVITTDVPGCRETVVDGANGFLIPPWSSALLAEKMIYFIENPDQVKIMGLKSYMIAQEKFNAKVNNERLMHVLLGE